MHLRPRLVVALLLPAALFTPMLFSYGAGALPGFTGTAGTVPTNVTRALPGCGQCHRPNPGGNLLDVDVLPSARSLTPGQSITVTTTATGGRPHTLNWGGFASDVTAGTFSAGANSRVGNGGQAVTHQFAFQSNNRSWTYGYTAPTAPGPVEMYANVNTVDGDGQAGPGDLWAFHGGDGLETTPTPMRLFVNAPRVQPVGDSCVGAFGNFPVLGARTSPDAGNAAFALECIGAAPNTAFVLLLGTASPPLDLTVIGVTGCTLHVNVAVTLGATTSTGVAKFADATATVPLPIPAGTNALLRVQGAFIDLGSGRPLPLTVTNALDLTIR